MDETSVRTSDPAFKIAKVDIGTGETTVIIQKGILGGLANQLKGTSDQRKGFSIMRKLGHMLSSCGDLQYRCVQPNQVDISPDVIINK